MSLFELIELATVRRYATNLRHKRNHGSVVHLVNPTFKTRRASLFQPQTVLDMVGDLQSHVFKFFYYTQLLLAHKRMFHLYRASAIKMAVLKRNFDNPIFKFIEHPQAFPCLQFSNSGFWRCTTRSTLWINLLGPREGDDCKDVFFKFWPLLGGVVVLPGASSEMLISGHGNRLYHVSGVNLPFEIQRLRCRI